ncbi:Na(+)-translocating NADH-quinone reductase subunit C [Myxococcota bacterium]|nr:Na(+)-translocating NADH-quinone reductase subunit C [Myxococcota bacterium]
MEHSSRYIVLFAAAVCGVCSIFVAVSAVSLKERQELNQQLDIQKKVLNLAGLLSAEEKLPSEEISRRFKDNIVPRVVNLATGSYVDEVDADTFDQKRAAKDPDTSRTAPTNPAKVRRVPNLAVVYRVEPNDELKALILPIEGYGLWGTLYGFISLAPDVETIEGITFYEHKETPGLGGEVDNPRWKSLWKGRKAFDDQGDVRITVKKGIAGSPEDDPYHVDGLAGATITSRGVTNLLEFWLGEPGFGAFLDQVRSERGV